MSGAPDEGDRAEELPQHDAGGRRRATGPLITGRSFAGTSRASDQREQTADHRGDSQRYKLDAGGSRTDDRREDAADES